MSSLDTTREKSCNLDYDGVEQATQVQGRPAGGGSQAKALTFELVSQHFSMPIQQAARELNMGVTVLKKRCRELGIPRWPQRKLKKLQTLIDNVQVLVCLGTVTNSYQLVKISLHKLKICASISCCNLQELGKDTEQVDVHATRMAVERLQQTKKLIEERPEVPLDEATKQLSQACHKENWRRKLLNGQHSAP
jgi:hypothetical protein